MKGNMHRISKASQVEQSEHLKRAEEFRAEDWLPAGIGTIQNHQTELPRIAKDKTLVTEIEKRLPSLPTRHDLYKADAREMAFLKGNSVHLVVTSPPYWTLKKYPDHPNQLGNIEKYTAFLDELDKVWIWCYQALVPGGRLVCVVGDVCLSRRKNRGEHTVIPLHASIQERCLKLGFSNLAPIIWHKIANAQYEAEGNGCGFLGKPYEPNAVIKNDIEFILMERKPGGYRSPSVATRVLSVIPAEAHKLWFQQIWTGVTGASTKQHPAPYPIELAERLVRMFSFVGDTVLDPFMGTGTTSAAAGLWGRNSVGVEVDPEYFEMGAQRISKALHGHSAGVVVSHHVARGEEGTCSTSEKNLTLPYVTSGKCGKGSKTSRGPQPEEKTQATCLL
jgi:DNA modification methylase